MLFNILRRALGKKKCFIHTFAEDLWKGWKLNPDCPIAYAGPYAEDRPPF